MKIKEILEKSLNESIEGMFDLVAYWGKDFELMSKETKKKIKKLKEKYRL